MKGRVCGAFPSGLTPQNKRPLQIPTPSPVALIEEIEVLDGIKGVTASGCIGRRQSDFSRGVEMMRDPASKRFAVMALPSVSRRPTRVAETFHQDVEL